jgi:DNA-binding protein YbaB
MSYNTVFSKVGLAYAAAVCLLLSACEEAPKYDFSGPSFAGQKQIELDVQNISVDNDYQPNAAEQSLLRYFPVTPTQAVESWSRERLWAVGDTQRAVVHIIDASVKRVPKADNSKSELDKYHAHMAVEVNIYGDEKASRIASVNAEVQMDREIFNDASENAHRDFFAKMTRDMMNELDKNLTSSMNIYFQPFMAYGHNNGHTVANTQTIMPSAPISTTTLAPAPTISAEPYAPSSPEPRNIGTLSSTRPY